MQDAVREGGADVGLVGCGGGGEGGGCVGEEGGGEGADWDWGWGICCGHFFWRGGFWARGLRDVMVRGQDASVAQINNSQSHASRRVAPVARRRFSNSRCKALPGP